LPHELFRGKGAYKLTSTAAQERESKRNRSERRPNTVLRSIRYCTIRASISGSVRCTSST
jgi:hypothetical protein